ncbi:hypothetical protein [Methylomicrobium agile]|uniref:hypothetical protein n=1 Tax=Methylomicrobium agile TaxID=39774 RepID=UPI0012F6EABE|nr:hypothetical protein [Methylomicrobium agile]
MAAAFAAGAESGWVTVAKYNGAIQCESAGIGLRAMKMELAQAKTPVGQTLRY